jgi:hypothetical protein
VNVAPISNLQLPNFFKPGTEAVSFKIVPLVLGCRKD